MKTSLLLLPIFALVWTDSTVEHNKNSNKLFSASIYKEVVKTQGNQNVLVSPLSAQIIFALATAGAKGATAQELQTALHLSQNQTQLLPLLKGNGFTLETANRVYLRKNYPIKTEFKRVATDVFNSSLETVDFSESEATATAINNWVKAQTENKINDLVTPDVITQNTVALLINALYFKAEWLEQFGKHQTELRFFYKTTKDSVRVPTMHNLFFHTPFNFHQSTELDAKFLEIPFEGSGASMVFVLPLETEGITRLEAHIEDVLQDQPFERAFVDVALPKFKIEASTNFKKVFQNLGVNLAFTRRADFSGIGGEKGQIYISDAVQKALIDVNEVGVEAAAATRLKLVPVSLPPRPTRTFVADHPFIYYIKVNGLVLFIGKVVGPQ